MTDFTFTIVGDTCRIFNTAFIYLNDDSEAVIDWGDGTFGYFNNESEGFDEDDRSITHEYATMGEYEIKVNGIIGLASDIFFYDDETLKSMIIGANISTIGYGFVDECPNLESITFEGSVPPTASNEAFVIPNTCIIRVPTGSLNAYTSAENYPNPNIYTYQEYTPVTPTSNVPQDLLNLYGHLRTLHKQWFYDKYELDEDYLKKSSVPGLLKNDGTVDRKTYLTALDIEGKIDTASLSTIATTGNYEDLSDVPSTFTPNTHSHQVSEIIDNQAYSNIGTSANDSQDTINSAVDTRISALSNIELIERVNSLGTASANTMNKLYFVPEANAETDDAYEIYVTVRTGVTPTYTYTWEKIDTARIDLTNLSNITHVHGNIANGGTIGTNSGYFAYTTTNGLVTSKEKIGNITTNGAIGNDAGKVAVTTTNGEVTVSDWYQELDSLVIDLINEGLENNNNNGE